MRRVKHNVTFKKKEEPVDEPEDNEDITSEGDTPDPDPKPTALDDIPEGQQENIGRLRRGWTEDEKEKPTLKPAKDLKEDVPAKAPYAITSEGEEQQGTVKETEEQQEDMEKKYWQELETAEEEGRVADFEKVGGANFMTELMAIESDNIMNDFVIMHYESKADVIRNDEFSKLETDMSLGTREERKLYGHILKDEAVWSLRGRNEKEHGTMKVDERFSNSDGNSNFIVENESKTGWHQLTRNEELKLTTTYGDEDADTVLNTPQTPIEELGGAVYGRAKPASKFGKEYIRQRTDHGIPDKPTSEEASIESKLPDEVEDEFIIDLGVMFDKSVLGKELLDGNKFHRDEDNNIINTPAEGAVDIYNIVKDTAIRTLHGIVGRDYNELKPFLNEEGTEKRWNIEPPMANFTHPINDIRAHVVNELLDSLSPDDMLKLTQSDPNTQPSRNTAYVRGKEEYGGIIQDHPEINKIVEDALKKQGIDPYKEQFFDQDLIFNVLDNIRTEHGVGGERLEDELGYTYEDVLNRNIKFVRMTVADFQGLHDPIPINFKDGSTNEETVEYFKDRIRRGLFMPTVNLVHDVVTNNYIRHQGRHRAEAARQMGLTHIPVVIRLASNSTSRYGRRIASQDDIYFAGANDPDSPLPKTMNELIKFPTLLRRFLGNTHDRSSREFFGAGEMDNYAHTEHGKGRPSEWDRKQQNFEEIIFLTHVEQVQENAHRIATFRSKFRLNNMLDEYIQNYGGSFENQSSAIRGIVIEKTKNIHGTTNIDLSEDNLFTELDIQTLGTQTNNMEMHGNWIKASAKFYKLLDNNPNIKKSFEEAEELVNSQLNRPNARDFERGAFRILYRSMPKIEMGRNVRNKRLNQPLVSGRRGRGVFNFMSLSLSPSSAMNESQPFHTAGGITMEFGSSMLRVLANEMLRKTDPLAKIKLVEYTVYPVETVGESPTDRGVWNIETIDSKMPIAFAHELELRIPVNTKIENAVEGMIVDLGSYANLQRVFDSYGMKSEGKLYKKYMSEHMESHTRSEIIEFFLGGKNGEYKVPYGNAIESTTSILNKLDRVISKYANLTSTASSGTWGIPEGKRPKIRYKFDRYRQMDHSVIMNNMHDGRQEPEYKTAFEIAMGQDADSTYTATADQKITDYISTMIDKITPSDSERADTKREYEKIEEALWKEIRQGTIFKNEGKDIVRSIFLGGSTGKNTNLTGSSDLDIFIEFEYPIPQQEIDYYVGELGKSTLLPMTSGNYTEKYGVEGINDDGTKFSHKYPEGYVKYHPKGADGSEKIEVQLLGVSHVTEEQIARGRNGTKDADGNMITDGMKTGNDRSIMHTKVIKPLLFGREHEVRLLKNWLKENGIYDSSGKERGLSGYASELLIIHKGSFTEVLEYFANFKPYSKLGNTDRDFDSMFVLIDMIDKNRNLGAAFSDPEGSDHIKKNLKLARLIKASKFMLEHGRSPKLQRTKRESVHISFEMPKEDENATYQQLYSITGKIYNALKREKYGVDSAVEIISEGFEIELPRIDIEVTDRGEDNHPRPEGVDNYLVTMYIGFKPDPKTEVERKTILEQSHLQQSSDRLFGTSPNSSHMMKPEWFWEEGIPTNQPQDRIDKWKKAAKIRLNRAIGNLHGEPFKTEVDEKGIERWYIRMYNNKPWVGDWLRDQISKDKLGLGKFNKLMLAEGKAFWEYTPSADDKNVEDNHKTFENVTGSKKEGMWRNHD